MRPKQAAEYMGISPEELNELCKSGKLKFSKTPGGHRRFNEEDLPKKKKPFFQRMYELLMNK